MLHFMTQLTKRVTSSCLHDCMDVTVQLFHIIFLMPKQAFPNTKSHTTQPIEVRRANETTTHKDNCHDDVFRNNKIKKSHDKNTLR
jgi:hypothetical protein